MTALEVSNAAYLTVVTQKPPCSVHRPVVSVLVVVYVGHDTHKSMLQVMDDHSLQGRQFNIIESILGIPAKQAWAAQNCEPLWEVKLLNCLRIHIISVHPALASWWTTRRPRSN